MAHITANATRDKAIMQTVLNGDRVEDRDGEGGHLHSKVTNVCARLVGGEDEKGVQKSG